MQPCKKKMEKKEEKWPEDEKYCLSKKTIFFFLRKYFEMKINIFFGIKYFPTFLPFSPFSFCKVAHGLMVSNVLY